jgi:hypothetical protein
MQFSTRWDAHNQTPITLTIQPPPALEGLPSSDVFRFYFDGLVPYFYRPGPRGRASLGTAAVGANKTLMVGTIKFEKSWQESNISRIILETVKTSPETVFGPSRPSS